MQKRSLCSNFLPVVFILLILSAVTTISIPFAKAQMLRLSEIQNNIFFLSHKDAAITPATFDTDRYIDYEQAEYFSEISKPKIYTPADNNYPFTLVDHYILDSDLVVKYDYDYILGPYPPKAYLSRHNISIADYTSQKIPPEVFMRTLRAKEPFHNDKVVAVSWILNNYEYELSEKIYHYKYIDHKGSFDGYLINVFLRVSGKFAVWVGDTHQNFLFSSSAPANLCLPQSDIKKPNFIQIVRTPYDTSHPGNWPAMPILLPPRSHCYYPLPTERNSAAATNWSYNYNLRNNSPASDLTNNRHTTTSQTNNTTCQTCKTFK